MAGESAGGAAPVPAVLAGTLDLEPGDCDADVGGSIRLSGPSGVLAEVADFFGGDECFSAPDYQPCQASHPLSASGVLAPGSYTLEARVDVNAEEFRYPGKICEPPDPLGMYEVHLELEEIVLPAAVDILPGSDGNPVHLLRPGVLPVAVLGTAAFDVREVDLGTLRLGPDAAPPVHRVGGHLEDVDGDGTLDLLSHYDLAQAGIAFGDREACVRGELRDGRPFEGCDGLRVLSACGIGFELALVLPPLLWCSRRRSAAQLRVR